MMARFVVLGLVLTIGACSPDPGASPGVEGGAGGTPTSSTGGSGATGGATVSGGGMIGSSAGSGGASGGSGLGGAAGVGGAAANGGVAGAFGGAAGSGGIAGSGGAAGFGGAGAGGIGGYTGGGGGAAGAGGAFGGDGGTSGSAGGGQAGMATGGQSGAAGSGGSNAPATFAAVAAILEMSCGHLSCHGGGEEGQDLVLTGEGLHQTLLTRMVEPCNDKPLVVPNDPANSALVMLPTWQCNDFVMPQGCIDDVCLPAADMATITAWIQAGALGP